MRTSIPSEPATPSTVVIAEVKYSLPQMLQELRAERSAGSFALEKLDQNEIGKLFKAKAPRRVKPKM
jgi:FKBP-type peptidyl-prolyl cis-trans isomerase (trigger factor)